MVEIEFVNGGDLVLIRFSKGLLALDRQTFVQGLRMGKKHERRTALEARMTPVPYVEIDEPIAGDRVSRVAHVRHETVAEREATTRAKESSMAVFLTIELPTSELTSEGHFGRNGFQPQVNPAAVVQYAMEKGVNDLQTAYKLMRQDQASQRAVEPTRNFRQQTRGAAKATPQQLRDVVAPRRPGLPWQ